MSKSVTMFQTLSWWKIDYLFYSGCLGKRNKKIYILSHWTQPRYWRDECVVPLKYKLVQTLLWWKYLNLIYINILIEMKWIQYEDLSRNEFWNSFNRLMFFNFFNKFKQSKNESPSEEHSIYMRTKHFRLLKCFNTKTFFIIRVDISKRC